MADLKMRTETVHTVQWHDLEDFISEHYPGSNNYTFVADQECGNDSSHRFSVDTRFFYNEELDSKDIEEFNSGGFPSYVTGMLLNDLCRRELLPAGDYIVEVSW